MPCLKVVQKSPLCVISGRWNQKRARSLSLLSGHSPVSLKKRKAEVWMRMYKMTKFGGMSNCWWRSMKVVGYDFTVITDDRGVDEADEWGLGRWSWRQHFLSKKTSDMLDDEETGFPIYNSGWGTKERRRNVRFPPYYLSICWDSPLPQSLADPLC